MSSKRFENQTAFVTGAAEGIGKGVAHRLAQEGATVVLCDINESSLKATAGEFSNANLQVETQCIDISQEPQVQEALDGVMRDHGRLDVVVNCAAVVGPTGINICDYPVEELDKLCLVNFRGAFLVTKYSIMHMRKRNYGRILLYSSVAGKEGNPNACGYSTTKAAVIGLVKGTGKEFAETGITVNGIAPAVIKTKMVEATAPQQVEYMLSKIPMKRCGTIEEAAALSAWIVSPECSFVTGFIFDLTGGRATY
ncbi:MAG: SDR family oxidoreductase [Chitinivibrionales bacterium]|nr:SDR family oxidoreductase [Chitinivibrionales bacterium]